MITTLALTLLSDPAPQVDYVVHVDAAAERADVTLVVADWEPEATDLPLALPESFAFVGLPEPLLFGPVTAEAEGRPLELERTGPFDWRVRTAGARRVTVRYAVALTHRTLPEVGRDAYEFPYVEADHGLLVAGAILMAPREITTKARRVRFELPDEPSGTWSVLAPWPDHVDGGFAPASDGALANDLVAIGAWETRSIEVGGFEAVIAVAPRQPGLLDGVAGPLEDIVRAELAIFGRAPTGRYLFLFGRPDLENGFGGSPKTSSMTLSISPSLRAEADSYVEHLVAHEFFHTWALARAPLSDELRWVNEGITDYYAHLVPLRLGRMPLEAFRHELGQKLATVDAARPAERSLEDAGGRAFFEEGAAYQQVYTEGLVLGAWLDAAIRSSSDLDLDELMRAFLNDPRWDDPADRPQPDDFLARVRVFAGDEVAARLSELTRSTAPIDWVELFRSVDVELVRSTHPPQLTPRANFDGTTVTATDPSGLGFRLGLRDGDRLVEVNGRPVSSTEDVYAAWAAPDGDRLEAVVVRGAREHFLDEPLRDEVRYTVVRGVWESDVPEAR